MIDEKDGGLIERTEVLEGSEEKKKKSYIGQKMQLFKKKAQHIILPVSKDP